MIPIEIHDLRILSAVVDYGGITRAGKRLHMAQSAVSQSILRLEHELQVQLLFRLPGSGGVRPTEAGQAMAGHARAILSSLTRAEDEMKEFRGLIRGTVSLGILSTASWFLLAPLLRRLRAEHPGLQVRAFEATGPTVLEQLRLGYVDLAVVFLPMVAEGLAVSAFGDFELYLIASPDHQLARQQRVNLNRLATQPWVAFGEDPGRSWVETPFHGFGQSPAIRFEADSVSQIKIFVEAGLGLTLLPLPAVATEVQAGQLCALTVSPPSKVTVGCATVLGPTSPAVGVVMSMLHSVVADLNSISPEELANAPEAV